MPIPVISYFTPVNSGQFPVALSDHIKGGYRSVGNTTIRDAIGLEIRNTGMIVHTQENGKSYRLTGGITNSNWVEEISTSAGSGFSQSFSSATGYWLVTHGLGYFPQVTCLNLSSGVIFGQTSHFNTSSLAVRFNSAVAGILYCS